MRELSNVIERAVLLKAGAQIEPSDFALGPMNAAEEESATKAGDYRLAIDRTKGIVLEEIEARFSRRCSRAPGGIAPERRSCSVYRARRCAIGARRTT